MDKLSVKEAEALVEGLFAGLPAVVLDFVARSWRTAVACEEPKFKAMATVPATPRSIVLRAGGIYLLRAPYELGLYVTVDSRGISPELRLHFEQSHSVVEPEGSYDAVEAPWAIGVAVDAEVLVTNLDEVTRAHVTYVRAVSGRQSGARFGAVDQNAVATVLNRHGRALERKAST